MKLSDRLNTVASFVTNGYRLADIGTDHGYIPIELVKNNVIPYAYAMDINDGPLLRAKEHIDEYDLADKIETRLSNGLEKLSIGEADSILIAGMGGALIIDILTKGIDVAKSANELILSPHSEIYEVRQFMEKNGFVLVKEEMLMDMGKYYVIMKYNKGSNLALSDCELNYGPLLLKEKNIVCKQYLDKEKDNIQKIIFALPDNGKSDTVKRKKELKEKLKLVVEALDYF